MKRAGATHRLGLLAGALSLCSAVAFAATPAAIPAPTSSAASDSAVAAALGDLGLALLRQPGKANAVVSPVALATVLGMVHAGANGPAEREIEALFGAGAAGAQAMRGALPTLVAGLGAEAGAAGAAKAAARLWIDRSVASEVPKAFHRRIAARYGAQAQVLSFAEPELARAEINRWTAERTAGRVADLLPPGSVARSTQITLTSALHFRSAWKLPFEPERTEPRPFSTAAGASATVPTMVDERAVAQAEVDGAQVYALPFGAGYDLVLALPAAGASLEDLLRRSSGTSLARWRAALQPARCSLALPKFNFAPKAGSIKPALEALGVKTVFSAMADLRPMLGRAAGQAHVDDVLQAAGVAIDEQGGEAVAATAATVKPKSLAAPVPNCAVDRAFAFAIVHRSSGAPLFMGRVGDPSRVE